MLGTLAGFLTNPIGLCIAALVVAYVAFCFASEQLNPFVRPKGPMRRPRWRFGRRVAGAVLTGAACAAAGLALVTGLTMPGAGVLGLAAAAPVALWAWLSYRRRSNHWEHEAPTV